MKEKIHQQLIKLTSDLISYKSVAGNSAAKEKVINFAAKQLKTKAIKTFCVNGNWSLFATGESKKKPELILYAHLDVVPAEDEDFNATIKGNRLYGRGAGDMKSAAAANIFAFNHLISENPHLPIALMLTTDEEIGGLDGTAYLVKKLKLNPKIVIMPDSSKGLRDIIIGQKGVMHLKVFATGKAAHGSRPFLGENALEKLIEIYKKIQKFIVKTTHHSWQRTLNLGKLHGGEQFNKVPDYAEMELDVRYINEKEKELILEKIAEFSDGNCQVLIDACPFALKENNPHLQLYKETIEKFSKQTVTLHREEGGSDARFFPSETAVLINGIKKGNSHAKNEWADTKEMLKFYEVLIEFIPKALA